MPKSKKEIVYVRKTEEDQLEINKLGGVRLSLVDRNHVERFINQVSRSPEITEGQRLFIKKLQHKYRRQIV